VCWDGVQRHRSLMWPLRFGLLALLMTIPTSLVSQDKTLSSLKCEADFKNETAIISHSDCQLLRRFIFAARNFIARKLGKRTPGFFSHPLETSKLHTFFVDGRSVIVEQIKIISRHGSALLVWLLPRQLSYVSDVPPLDENPSRSFCPKRNTTRHARHRQKTVVQRDAETKKAQTRDALAPVFQEWLA
jgi:hypothetical protein